MNNKYKHLFTSSNSIKSVKTTRSINEYVRDYELDIDLDGINSDDAKATDAVFIKGDVNTSILKINLLFRRVRMNVTGYTITANVKEGNKKPVTIPCEMIDSSNGEIQIKLPSNIVDEKGTNSFELVLQKGNKVMITSTYTYKVLNSLGEGTLNEEPELTVLQSLIQQVQDSKETVDNITTELEVTQGDINDILAMVGGL